jgi:acetoin utilization protein AcuB
MSKSKAIPPVRKFMSTSPHTIGVDQTMELAHRMMREHKIRHLPVLRAQELVGIVSAGDLHLVETLHDVDPAKVTVEDAMTQDPYTVGPDTPVDEVVMEMARHKYGSVIIMDNHHVVGVFTTNDACQAFAELLHTRLA